MKKFKKIIWLIIIFILCFILIKGWWDGQLSPVAKSGQDKAFVIAKGESFTLVTKHLVEQKLIKSDWAFAWLAKQNKLTDKLQTGTFKISPALSAREVLQKITSNPDDNWVTLIEGWRVEEMAEKLNLVLGVDSTEFIKVAKEGYMFPDTYLFPKGYSPSQIARIMLDNFDKKYSEEIKKKVKSHGLSEAEGVILASIVEREGRSQEVRTMIASILLKRLKIGMGLNADATVQYALVPKGLLVPPPDGWWKKRVLYADLEVDSPYNTYLHAGLPPAPISNPSLSSLQAVAEANTEIPYLYYFHDTKGNSYYASTLDEHNQNIANYR